MLLAAKVPKTTAPMPARFCINRLIKPATQWEWRTKFNVSTMKEEKVVKAPMKPTNTAFLTAGETWKRWAKKVTRKPASRHPTTFTTKVPHGKEPELRR